MKKYPSIKNLCPSLAKKIPDIYDFYLEEKIHGANFSFIVENGEISYASRTQNLTLESSFFGFQEVAKKYHVAALKVGNFYGGRVQIFGELFGGHYPSMPNPNGGGAVQSGVWYCPQKDFVAFDILVNDEYYVNYDERRINLIKSGFVTPPFITKINICDISKFNPEFITKVPNIFGCQDIEDNFAEGVVARPAFEDRFPDKTRMIFKIKSEKFSESKVKHNSMPKPDVSNNVNLCLQVHDHLINENRLQSAVSKVGEFCKENHGKILKEFISDVLSECRYGYGYLSASDTKVFNKEIAIRCSNFAKLHNPDFIKM